jgi:hypothetical protein
LLVSAVRLKVARIGRGMSSISASEPDRPSGTGAQCSRLLDGKGPLNWG